MALEGAKADAREDDGPRAPDEDLMNRLEDDMDMHGRREAGLIAAMVIGAGLAVGPGQALGEPPPWDYDRAKTATWEPLKHKARFSGGSTSGKIWSLTHAMGDCAHGYDLKDRAGGSIRTFPDALYVKLKDGGNKPNDVPVPKDNYKYTRHTFPQRDVSLDEYVPPPGVEQWPPSSAVLGVAHAQAEAKLDLLLKRNNIINNPTGAVTEQMETTLSIQGYAVTQVPNPGETTLADSAAGITLELEANILKADWNDRITGRTGAYSVKGKTLGLWGHYGDAGRVVRFGDPVELSFYDEFDHALLGTGTIYHDDFQVSGNASITWDPLGDLVITADMDATASIVIFTPSDWILNPFNAAASIAEGVFTAGGMFAGLPWSVGVDGDTVTATLPTADIPHDFGFIYDVSSLPDADGDVTAVLDTDTISRTSSYDTRIPSPGTLTLLGIAGLLAVGRQRT